MRKKRTVSLAGIAKGGSSVRGPRGTKGVPATVFYVPKDPTHPLYRGRLDEVERFLATIRAFLVDQAHPEPSAFDETRARWTKKLFNEIGPALKPVFHAHLTGKRGPSPKVDARRREVDRLEREERVKREAESLSSEGTLADAVRKTAARREENPSTVKRSLYPRKKRR